MSDEPQSGQPLRLASRLDVVAAEELHAQVLKRVSDDDPLSIDARDVELVDTPAIQVLLAAAAHQLDRGARFLVINPSTAFAEAMTLLGLSSKFEEWSETNG